MRLLLIAAVLIAPLASSAAAEAPSHLQRTQGELRRMSQHGATSPLLDQAQRAIAVAERAAAAGRGEVAERALDIADAAMTLLRARRARVRARAGAMNAQRRAAEAEARAAEARRALEVTRAQRRAHDAAALDGAVVDVRADGGGHETP